MFQLLAIILKQMEFFENSYAHCMNIKQKYTIFKGRDTTKIITLIELSCIQYINYLYVAVIKQDNQRQLKKETILALSSRGKKIHHGGLLWQ